MFEEAAGFLLRSYTDVHEAVEEGVDSCKAKLLQQEELTRGSRDAVFQILVRSFICLGVSKDFVCRKGSGFQPKRAVLCEATRRI